MHTRTLRDRAPIQAALDRLDDEVAGYGRAVETTVAARAGGCSVPSSWEEVPTSPGAPARWQTRP